MYDRPHLIWVVGFVFQSAPADAIFDPGSDCGMPVAPDDALYAFSFQPLSPFHRFFKAAHCGPDQPRAAARASPIFWFADEPPPPPPSPSRPRTSPPRPPSAFRALPGRLAMETRPFFAIAARAFGSDPKIFFAIVVPLAFDMPLSRPPTRWPPIDMNTRDGDLMPKNRFTAPTTGSTTWPLIQPPMPFIATRIPDFRPEIMPPPLPGSQPRARANGPFTGLMTWEVTQPPMLLPTE